MKSIISLTLFIWNILLTSGANLTLENNAPTNWGYWGSWEFCPSGTFAGGMQLKVQGRQWRSDDTALNAIKLECVDPFSPNSNGGSIMSSEGAFGEWGSVFKCEKGFLVGFQLRSEGNLGTSGDNTAANNVRVFCSNPTVGVIEGDGMSWGGWGAEQRCTGKQAICGLETQVSWNLGQYVDNVGLNNAKMLCCDIPYDISSCSPSDGWEQVVECDNTQGTAPLPCKLDKKRGLGGGKGLSDFVEEMENVGFGLDIAGAVLPKIFSEKLGKSNKTGHDWTDEPQDTWEKVTTTSKDFNAAPGKTTRVYQVVGSCGPLSIHTTQFKKEESDDPF